MFNTTTGEDSSESETEGEDPTKTEPKKGTKKIQQQRQTPEPYPPTGNPPPLPRKVVPVAAPQLNVVLRRHGCTSDVRAMYLATIKLVPTTEGDLNQKLVNAKLVSKEDINRQIKKKKKKAENLDVFGKVKKRRYYVKKGQRITNQHLVGTEIGEALARAEEKQRRGEEVGNGGM